MEPKTRELYSFILKEERFVIRGRASVIDDRVYAVFDGPIEEMIDKLGICAARLAYAIEQNQDEESGKLRGFFREDEEE